MENKIEITQKGIDLKAIIIAILGIVYGVSPIDIVPDALPIAGWVDDLVITGSALLNLVDSYAAKYSILLSSILKILKWGIIILGGILIALILLIGVTIFSIFK